MIHDPARRDGTVRVASPFRALHVAGYTAAVGLALVHLWMLRRYAVNVPSLDDFTQILAVPGYVEYTPGFGRKLAFLFSPTPDHRIFTMRALAYVQARFLGGLDFRSLLFFGNALCLGAGLLVLRQAPASDRWWLAPVFALVLFSPAHWEGQYWPTGAISHLAVVFYGLSALYCARNATGTSTLLAAALALCSAFTVVNGLVVFPAAAVELWLLGRRRAASMWLVAGAIVAVFYFMGDQSPAGRTPVLHGLAHPFALVSGFFAALGSLAEMDPGHAGSTLLGIGLAVLAAALLLPSRRRHTSPLLIGWLVFIVGSDAMITAGRAHFGVEALVLSRYRIYSAFAVLVVVAAYVVRPHGRDRSWRAPSFAGVVVAWAVAAWHVNVVPLTLFAVERRVGLDHYVATGAHGMYLDFPAQAFGDFLLERARDAGVFRVESQGGGTRLVEVRGQHADLPPFFEAIAEPFVQGGAVSVYGRSARPVRNVFVYLGSSTREYRGATTWEPIPDPLPGVRQAMWWGTYPLSTLAPGRYRVGYAIEDAPDAAVFWTDRRIDVPACAGAVPCAEPSPAT